MLVYLKFSLKEWRRLKGVPQTKLADALEVNVLTYSRWENGETKMPVQAALKACSLLGISVEEVNFFANS